MKQIAAAAALAVTLGGCSVYRDATSARIDTTANWRTVATDRGRDSLRNWRQAWDDALPGARAANATAIDADPLLFDPDRALPDPLLPAGKYRCRTYKMGKGGTAVSGFIPYPWQECTITDEGEARGLSKLTGSQRPAGLIFPDTAARAIFLGTLILGDESAPLRYGLDPDRDMIGYVEHIEPRRWRLVMPYPRFESTLDVIELVPAS
ncbi:DUF4893 domain-containing protein [Sphingomonas sp. JC676]|uniref:DUF4893 domain-containing protein n=1 Tax=Sphingomonas sp. JC676 TaxID=2768065 RepID=UPI001657B6AA|nr:DUF4893 domain-containing protein [Sphingomonas sp. JC676]MBC9033447.1 DUF4893 domain-containing protein [Sphingomonas sp. JC676]